MDNKRVSTQVYMSSETRRRLRKLAADRDMSVNDLIRETLQKQFDSEGVDIDMSDGIEPHGGYRGVSKEDEEN